VTRSLTGRDNYFEDFQPGDLVRHARGKTVTEMDNVLLTNLLMNTAQGHFNEHVMASREFGTRITFGGIVAAMVIGLATQDTAENALRELRLDGVRFLAPVVHGDTLYAYTEVVEKTAAEREDAGAVRFRHWGVNQDDQVVFECERWVLVKRRSHWGLDGGE
jgi:acyl dehydratase